MKGTERWHVLIKAQRGLGRSNMALPKLGPGDGSPESSAHVRAGKLSMPDVLQNSTGSIRSYGAKD